MHATPEPGDRFDPQHRRFRHACTGLKRDRDFRCGHLHDCSGHVQDRYPRDHPQAGKVIPGSPWRPCRNEHPPGTPCCRLHGLNQVTVAAAQELLAQAAFEAADTQLALLRSDDEAAQQRAINSILDRAGVTKRTKIPTDLVGIIRNDPTELRRLLNEIRNDPELQAKIEAVDDGDV